MQPIKIQRVCPKCLPSTVEIFRTEVYPWNPAEADAHFADHASGGGDSFLAWDGEKLAGYLTIRWVSHNSVFRENNIPLIHHLAVFEPYRKRGIATQLMDSGEGLIATRATKAGITVGIFDEYGAAQRLYVKRGYIPDGRGVCQGHHLITRGEIHRIDDDLIIWMTKDLTG
ncbi:MAG: GNAT family N-acetyltransferase [Armatimonadetes bacterium]|nr:GNAT family N-acetyltransferase [Armatimonadota bacterium]